MVEQSHRDVIYDWLTRFGLGKIAKAYRAAIPYIAILSALHEIVKAIEAAQKLISYRQIFERIVSSILVFSGYFVLSFIVLFLFVTLLATIVLTFYNAIFKARIPAPLQMPEIWQTRAYPWVLWICFGLALLAGAYQAFFQPLPERGGVALIISVGVGVPGVMFGIWFWTLRRSAGTLRT